MDGFQWHFFDRSFEEMLPWFAGAFFSFERKRLRLLEKPGSTPLCKDWYSERSLSPRLIKVAPNDKVCAVEINADERDIWFKAICRASNSNLFSFQHVVDKNETCWTSFSVRSWWVRYRGVTVYREDDGTWVFEARGKPEGFENTALYDLADIRSRLTPETVVDYMVRSTEVDYNRLHLRLFDRVAEIRSASDGAPLTQFEVNFQQMARYLP